MWAISLTDSSWASVPSSYVAHSNWMREYGLWPGQTFGPESNEGLELLRHCPYLSGLPTTGV